MDKRFERSEKIIRQAYLDLLSNKINSKISVSDICRLAECSRNTFYLHYDSKDHLLESIFDDIIDAVEKSCRPVVKDFTYIGRDESKMFTDQILKAIEEYKTFIKVLLLQEQWQFLQKLADVLLSSSVKEAELLKQTYHLPHLIYFTNGIVGFIRYWLQTNMSLKEAQQQLHEAVNFRFEEQ